MDKAWAFCQSHRSRIVKRLAATVGKETAEDLFSDAMVKFVRKADRVRGSWICYLEKTCTSTMLDYLRIESRRREILEKSFHFTETVETSLTPRFAPEVTDVAKLSFVGEALGFNRDEISQRIGICKTAIWAKRKEARLRGKLSEILL